MGWLDGLCFLLRRNGMEKEVEEWAKRKRIDENEDIEKINICHDGINPPSHRLDGVVEDET